MHHVDTLRLESFRRRRLFYFYGHFFWLILRVRGRRRWSELSEGAIYFARDRNTPYRGALGIRDALCEVVGSGGHLRGDRRHRRAQILLFLLLSLREVWTCDVPVQHHVCARQLRDVVESAKVEPLALHHRLSRLAWRSLDFFDYTRLTAVFADVVRVFDAFLPEQLSFETFNYSLAPRNFFLLQT